MRIFRSILFVFLGICLLGSTFIYPANANADISANSQKYDTTPRFERLTVEDGLPHATVLSVLQDQQGFMWFATADGLSRYDGVSFKNFRHDKDDPNSLSNNNTFPMIESRDGLIWVGTDPGGLNAYDPATGKFTVYRHDSDTQNSLIDDSVWTLYEDKDGRIWVGTRGGISRLDRETGSFTNYFPDEDDPRSLLSQFIFRIYEDKEGTVWIGTNIGLQRYGEENDDFSTFVNDPDDPKSISSNSIWGMHEDSQGNFWIATRGGGLNLMDRETETFIAYRNDPNEPNSLHDDNLWNVFEDSNGNLWTLSENHGIALFDRENGTFTTYEHNPNNPSTVSNNDLFWMTEDNSGVLWISSRYGGVNKLYPSLSQFGLYRNIPGDSNTLNSNEVYSILAEEDGIIWIGTFGGGLNRYDRETGRMTVYMHDPEDPSSIGADKIYYIHQDEKGLLWLATYGGGLNRLNPRTKEITVYLPADDGQKVISSNSLTSIESAGDDLLWVGTLGYGLDLFNTETGLTIKTYQNDPADANSLSENTLYDIATMPSGEVWIATARSGLELLDPKTDIFTHHLTDPDDENSILSNTVHALYFDEGNQIIWAGTAGGLSGLDIATGEWQNYTEKEGLPSDTIVGIQSGNENDLWVSTTKGISRFNRDTQTFYNYYAQDGLQGDQFQIASSHLGPDGEIFFGGSNGLTFFHPEDLTNNSYSPPVVFTEFFLANRLVPVGSDILPQPIEKTTHITLEHDQNAISLQFAALSYQLSSKNLYSYRLDGFDEDWSPPRIMPGARYTNLPSGSYTFMVRAANNDGIWNETPTELAIKILPPWWGTWWFILLAILTVVMFIGGVFWLRLRNIRAINRELEKRVNGRTKELQDAKENLHRANNELENNLAEVVSLQEELKEQAIRDALTGLYNRRYLSEMLESEFTRAKRNNHPVAFLLMDLDHFKEINDTYGHQAGDEILIAIAKTISEQIRGSDIAFRYGGEEFMVVMPEIGEADAFDRAEELRKVIKTQSLQFGEKSIQVTTSIGVSTYPEHGESSDEVLTHADNALYEAKSLGRNQVVLCSCNL